MKKFVALLGIFMVFAVLSVNAQVVDLQKTDAPKTAPKEKEVEEVPSQLPPVDDVIFVPCRMLSTSRMMTIVKRAALGRHWIPVENGRNCMRCTLKSRNKHRLVVDVIIARDRLIIRYVDSENLDVDPVKRTIHRRYKSWINNLTHDIDRMVASEP